MLTILRVSIVALFIVAMVDSKDRHRLCKGTSMPNLTAFQTTWRTQEKPVTTFITFALKHDECPMDISWMLVTQTVDGTLVDSRQAGFYAKPRDINVHYIVVVPGVSYSLGILDDFVMASKDMLSYYTMEKSPFLDHPQ